MVKTSFVTIPNARITQKYNNYNPTMYGGDGRHKGIDYGILAANPVYACMSGDVTTAIVTQTGYGRNVRITHPDGSVSIYGHLSKLLVKVGDKVEAGQEIGKSGGDPNDAIDGDGFSTGAHLHWEIRPPNSTNSDQGAVDPSVWCLKYYEGIQKEATVIPYDGLNVRTSAVTGAVIYTLPHREVVYVIEEIAGWGRLLSLRPEWCSLSYLTMTGKIISPEVPSDTFTDAEKLTKLWEAHPELHNKEGL